MALDLSYRPNVLYLASIERIVTARRLVDDEPRDYVVAAYLVGLAVETILQAMALRHGAAADAKHDLSKWLSKCPESLIQDLKGSYEWSYATAVWNNGLRYLSFKALVGHLREKKVVQGRKGGVESIVRGAVKSLVSCAGVVHERGMLRWKGYTAK